VIYDLTLPDLSRYCQTVPAELPSLPLEHKRQLPPVPAVYFALGEDSEVLYIGRSISLSARWSAHHRFPELQSLGNVRLAWIEFETEEFLEEVEQVLIDHFSPKLNGLWGVHTSEEYGTICIRLSLKEKAIYEETARSFDRKVSDWLRALARAKLRELGISLDQEEPEKKPRKKKR
jgi:excinuclease UvrABC nuclease subunit